MAATRANAREAVLDGRVLVSGAPATKPSRMVQPSEPIELAAPPRSYVSRGGEKLRAALTEFGLDVKDFRCLDVGSSTGGFTDCLLQAGAASVVCVDVGRGQLDWSLRTDPRVSVMESTDIRDLDASSLGCLDLVVADLAFISLRTVLPSLAALASSAPIVALVKPQFEVGRSRVGKGGVVRDPALHVAALSSVVAAAERLGLRCRGAAPSPLDGAEGNREFFVHLRRAA